MHFCWMDSFISLCIYFSPIVNENYTQEKLDASIATLRWCRPKHVLCKSGLCLLKRCTARVSYLFYRIVCHINLSALISQDTKKSLTHLNLSVMTSLLRALTQVWAVVATLRWASRGENFSLLWDSCRRERGWAQSVSIRTRFSVPNLCKDFHFQSPSEEEGVGLQGWTADTTFHTATYQTRFKLFFGWRAEGSRCFLTDAHVNLMKKGWASVLCSRDSAQLPAQSHLMTENPKPGKSLRTTKWRAV